ncbi:MAG: 3-hydroxyacyl-CoA dehydrogenase [Rhizobium sp.]|nr:3-hydroxyacyl-CoA dehydrogenase [Rhizobium sp.]
MNAVACIGTGTVGRAWAVVFARAGHEVRVFDALAGEVELRTLPGARRTLDLLAENGMLDEPVGTVLDRIKPAATIAEAVTNAAYVQESVREDVAVKRAVFAEIAAHAPPDAILASSTSAIPGSEFLTDITSPERALVVHPVNPPSLIPLVELCGTGKTSQKTIDCTRFFMRAAGMRPIVLKKEIDGFILNRLQFALVAEAWHLVGEGYCEPDDIDAVLTDGLALRWASIGPFEVAHLNAPDGVQGFVDRLGPMMKHLGRSVRTDYDWTAEQAASAHAHVAERIPLEQIAERQTWRDRRILALRRMKRDVPDPIDK